MKKAKLGIAGVLAAACMSLVAAPSAYAADPILGRASTVVNQQTGRCLDSDLQGNVYTKSCTVNNPYQQWVPRGAATEFRLENVRTGLCLAAISDTEVRALRCAPNYYPQTWSFISDGGSNALMNQKISEAVSVALDSDDKGNAYLKLRTLHNRYQSWLFFGV
ncbi:RICIN domain-containing protein [Streptomyces chrestomyceticus]|uniref:RICIN domain-containing protein n=1 Tax=Streptomyces chrestomyceticus TaxID=68185 RepID=UPI0019D043BE|nr:ricin-type beta-trefoil lectin domain protein [Streptomyces chrestomyceticus]